MNRQFFMAVAIFFFCTFFFVSAAAAASTKFNVCIRNRSSDTTIVKRSDDWTGTNKMTAGIQKKFSVKMTAYYGAKKCRSFIIRAYDSGGKDLCCKLFWQMCNYVNGIGQTKVSDYSGGEDEANYSETYSDKCKCTAYQMLKDGTTVSVTADILTR